MKFKMLSVKELANGTWHTACRFPLLTFLLCAGAANSLYMNIYQVEKYKYISRNIFMGLLLILPVLYSMRIFYESGWIGKHSRLIINSVTVIAGFSYIYYLPNQTLISFYSSQFTILFISSLLLCLVCVRQGAKDDDFYWHFHSSLIVRLAITLLYIIVIIGGTSAALGAIDTLFKTKLINSYEFRIIIITLWIFAPLFFLSGVQILSDSKKTIDNKPGWLKNIAIYVMVPLTTVYLGILYAYAGWILFQWKLPDGTVSSLVLSFAAFGIVSLLVIFPYQKDENSKCCYWFARYFYILQIPLLFLLFLSVFTRVSAYGITVARYYVLVLAIWLLFLTVFMIIRKNRNLIVIPLSLLLLTALSILGPWSAFNVSYISQKGRLLKLLNANNLILKGKITPAIHPLPFKVRAEISSIAKYLDDYGNLQDLKYIASAGRSITSQSFTKSLGFTYVNSYSSDRKQFNYMSDDKTIDVPIAGYRSLIRFRENLFFNGNNIIRLHEGDLVLKYFPKTTTFQFTDGKSRKSQINLQQVADHFQAISTQKNEKSYTYQYKDSSFEILCLFDRLSGWEDQTGVHIDDAEVDFLIKWR